MDKENKALKVIDRFSGLYEKFGVNYEMMRLILKTKLLMDTRRAPAIMTNSTKNQDKTDKFGGQQLLYGVMGVFIAIFVLIKFNIMIQMTMYFGMIMFFIGMCFIVDFASVLLDVKDKNILGITGVDAKTINAAKLTNVIIYMTTVTLYLGGPGALVSFRYGILFGIVFIIELILINLFMVLLTCFIYYLVLKFFDGEKLKDIINIIQIALTIVITIGYQLIGRVFDFVETTDKVFSVTSLWQWFIPSLWFAAPLEIIESGQINQSLIILTILAIVVPLVSIGIYFMIANNFENYIQKLNNNSYRGKDRTPLFFRVSNLICRSNTEKSFFNFTMGIIKSERNFKLRTYPNLAMGLIFPFIFLINTVDDYSSFHAWRVGMATSNDYYTMYLSIFILAPTIMYIKYSDQYKAAWIYKATPIADLSDVFKGVYKAVFYKMIFPVFIFVAILYTWIFGVRVIPNLIGIFLVAIFLSLIALKAMDKHLPFTVSFKDAEKMDDLGITIVIGILSGVLGGIQYFVTKLNFGIYIFIGIIMVGIALMWHFVSKGKYHKIKF
ncbi:ABC transporter permease [Clostridium sp. B9]|uniref:ABC transporter permease n=1 Tax=Clostridium sp. B9 TaxID=3423224 RepID=UPI003D2F517A